MTAAKPPLGSARSLGPALVTIAFLGVMIDGVDAPLITSVAMDLDMSLDAALLVALALVALGGLLTAIPQPFAALLVGRAFHGLGLRVAYPLMGLLDQLAGLRIAYPVGFGLSLTGVVVAYCSLPPNAPRPTPRVDIPGAALLGIGTLGVLLAVAQPSVWKTPWVGAGVLVVAAIALAAWVVVERRTPAW